MTNIRPSIPKTGQFSRPDTSPKKNKPSHITAQDRPPRGRGFRQIPDAGMLSDLVDRAVSAMRKGIYWDRGSILNIEV